MLMLFLLGWNKYFNVVDTLIKNRYVYTYANKNHTNIDYRVEGYMLLIVFIVKVVKFLINMYKVLNETKSTKPKNKLN
jgi:NADH:ubiquinone oxidoreductase subunit 5 (subunit L)/multisubunit Na+/H+ antiporter MnhA subunit